MHVISDEIIQKKVHVYMYKMNVLVMVWISNDLLLDALLCGRRVGRSYEEVDPAHIRLHPQHLFHKNWTKTTIDTDHSFVVYHMQVKPWSTDNPSHIEKMCSCRAS
jgi:hypothetical protein